MAQNKGVNSPEKSHLKELHTASCITTNNILKIKLYNKYILKNNIREDYEYIIQYQIKEKLTQIDE